MTIAKVQHYVPQFLLRNFGRGKKDQLWVFDKFTGRTFFTNIKNVASESRFYDFELEGEQHTLEPVLTTAESAAKTILHKLLDADSVAVLDEEERAHLAVFLSFQLARTRNMREQWIQFPRMLQEHLDRFGETVAPGSQAEQLLQGLDQNDLKVETGRFLLDAPGLFAEHFVSKHWVLAATSSKHPFMISDNPLSRQNMIEQSEYLGNLGLAVPGIEIYLPLTPTRALALWCTTLTEPILKRAEELGRNAQDYSDSLVYALQTGRPLDYEKQNVDNFNSLQIWHAERYVFSSSEDFSLAKAMVSRNEAVKVGPRMRSG